MTLTLDNYKTFDSIADLNEAIRLHLREHQYKLNATAIKVFEVVCRHAVKYAGASWLKIDSLARLIGKSATTTRRILALLERLGIVKRIAFMRKVSGGNGANIIVILPPESTNGCPPVVGREQAVEPTTASVEQPEIENETITLLSSKELLSTNTYSKPFKTFLTTAEALLGAGSRKLINRMYGVWLAHTSKIKHVYDADMLLHTGIAALRVTLQATKRKDIRNLAGFYNGTLDRMLDKLYFDEIKSYYI
ncbi:helix-turn-helix domain-containing protein [Planococcus beigongshangi]|uniref:helix-turn-helix domain-containing protein n=1 Tax=Planococcus beigongshangi TaxID=2782536 RepID=UPI00193BECEF|nr:helix-turn-helix domain-containing protein [Planococcus beigongshangi]